MKADRRDREPFRTPVPSAPDPRVGPAGDGIRGEAVPAAGHHINLIRYGIKPIRYGGAKPAATRCTWQIASRKTPADRHVVGRRNDASSTALRGPPTHRLVLRAEHPRTPPRRPGAGKPLTTPHRTPPHQRRHPRPHARPRPTGHRRFPDHSHPPIPSSHVRSWHAPHGHRGSLTKSPPHTSPQVPSPQDPAPHPHCASPHGTPTPRMAAVDPSPHATAPHPHRPLTARPRPQGHRRCLTARRAQRPRPARRKPSRNPLAQAEQKTPGASRAATPAATREQQPVHATVGSCHPRPPGQVFSR
ncbi:hypothetical protein SAMN05421869_114104 [Nonomuraea jiangxiensis]|uniref:Uncharacterized protein n=1 Tax=Nonomuraea jiangxiensis TaxID=633440 RepID=A0A1G8ZLF6_9ACTN|nr:hypothetical protein SAMN05421869_114104 [Nonomuraea jiangxiensis]